MDFHTALYHCREIEKHFEEMNEEPKDTTHGKSPIILECQKRLCMDSAQILAALRELDKSIEVQDDDSILRFEDLIDALVDYFDCLIVASERSDVATHQGTRIRKLKAWRESTGRLAQMLCQSND